MARPNSVWALAAALFEWLTGNIPGGSAPQVSTTLTLPDEGQQTMANSISVAVASDQSAVPAQGKVASGLPDTANPLVVGGRNVTAPVAADDGDAVVWRMTDVGHGIVAGEGFYIRDNTIGTVPRPVLQGARGSTATPAAVSADGDIVDLWATLSGSLHTTVDSLPNEGQQTMANSISVAVASDQSAVPVSAASLPLPIGAATAALQLPNSHDVTVDNAAGASAVNIQDGGNAVTVDWAGTAPPIGAGLEATALRVTVATDSTGVLSVDDNGSALTVDATNLDIRDLTSVSDSVAVLQATASSLNAQVVGSIADDAPTPGNPVVTGGLAKTPDGTDPGNVSAENDVAQSTYDLNRRLYVNPEHAWTWSYHENSSSTLTDAAVAADPGDGYQLVVTDIVVSTGAATAFNIFFEEGTSTVLGPYYLEAIAGRGLAIQFRIGKKITASTALTVTTSAAIAHSIDVQGYTQKV